MYLLNEILPRKDQETSMSYLTQFEPDPGFAEAFDFQDVHDLLPEELMHSIEDLMDICLWETDADAKIIKLGSTCINVFQSHPALLYGRNLLHCLCDEEWANERADLEAMFDGRYTFRSLSTTFETVVGRPVHLFLSGEPKFDPETGVHTGYRGIARSSKRHCSSALVDATEPVTTNPLLILLSEVANQELQTPSAAVDTPTLCTDGASDEPCSSSTVADQDDCDAFGTFDMDPRVKRVLERMDSRAMNGTKRRAFDLRKLSESINCYNRCAQDGTIHLLTDPDAFEAAIKELCAAASATTLPTLKAKRTNPTCLALEIGIDTETPSRVTVDQDTDRYVSEAYIPETADLGSCLSAAILECLGYSLSQKVTECGNVTYTITIPNQYILKNH